MATRTFGDTPFVARLSERNEVAVVERAGDLVCRATRASVILLDVFTLGFGCMLTYLIWFSLTVPESAPKSKHVPWFIVGFIGILALACWLAFFRNLLGTPCFEVSGATGEFSFFRWRTREPWNRLVAAEISHFTIEKQFYNYKQHQTENAVLILHTVAGERRALCGSPDEALIRSLGERLGNMTRRKVEGNG
jgi:hypothetical protein